MAKYILKRVIYMIPTLFAVALIVFFLMRLVPGDPARVMLGADAGAEQVQELRDKMGLNLPLGEQFRRYVVNLAHGRLGESIYYQEDVFKLLLGRLPATLELAGVALSISVLVAIPLGVTASVNRYSWIDSISSTLALIGASVPIFWLAILFIYVFGLQLKIFPLTGRGGPIWTAKGLRHVFLPAITLATTMLASTTRLTRSSMLDVLNQDYVRTAQAKGLAPRKVIYKHSLRNALIPVVTNIGLQLGVMLGGSFLTETVFAWPGLGRLTVQAVLRRDFPIIQGSIIILAAVFVGVNIVVDVVYKLLDPRIKFQ